MNRKRGELSKYVLLSQDKIPAHKSHVATRTIHDLGFEQPLNHHIWMLPTIEVNN